MGGDDILLGPMTGKRTYVGVDGCIHGWVAVVVGERAFVEAKVFASFEEVAEQYRAARVLAVDMPVGLVGDGPREADAAARAFLGKRRSSVFPMPPRAAVEAKSYDAACKASRANGSKSPSKQAFGLFAKILELDGFATDDRIHEVHPEVSFAVLRGGSIVPHRKKTWGGLHERLELLRAAGIELPGSLGVADAAGIDDVVDAAVAAWTARRIGKGTARSFPERAKQRDRSGRVIAIWA